MIFISFAILLSLVENILPSIHQTLKVFSSSLIRLSKVLDALSFLPSNYNQRIIIVIWARDLKASAGAVIP